ncbi:ferritin [candidate division GN15 bacterium]|nr:ferritin [candidate division GN15 bacterium]
MMISKKMEKALNTQINMELEAYYIYKQMSFTLEEMGLPVFGGFFADQAAEEQGHADKIAKYILDQGGKVTLQQLKAPKSTYKTVEEICKDFVDHEVQVTKAINKLVEQARSEKDTPTEVMLNWFVEEQVEEVASATEMLDMVSKTKTEGQLLMLEGRVARMRGQG